jgi:flagellar biosynthesis/type III secretory pathway protein FliH
MLTHPHLRLWLDHIAGLKTPAESEADVMSNPVFPAFVKNVTDKGYFKGCEEGSTEYKDRMAKVIASFKQKLEAVSSSILYTQLLHCHVHIAKC